MKSLIYGGIVLAGLLVAFVIFKNRKNLPATAIDIAKANNLAATRANNLKWTGYANIPGPPPPAPMNPKLSNTAPTLRAQVTSGCKKARTAADNLLATTGDPRAVAAASADKILGPIGCAIDGTVISGIKDIGKTIGNVFSSIF